MFENHWTCTRCVFACAFACFQESDLHKNVVVVAAFKFIPILIELSVQITVFVCSCHYLIFSSNLNVHIYIFTSVRVILWKVGMVDYAQYQSISLLNGCVLCYSIFQMLAYVQLQMETVPILASPFRKCVVLHIPSENSLPLSCFL